MKPEIAYIIIADNVLIEEKTSKPTFVGVFKDIMIPKDSNSVIIPQMVVFARIDNATGTKKAEVSIYDPHGEKFASVVLSGGGLDSPANLNLRAIFNVPQFTKTGTYKIKAAIDGKELDSKDSHSFVVSKKND